MPIKLATLPNYKIKFIDVEGAPADAPHGHARVIDIRQTLHSKTDYSEITCMDVALTQMYWLTWGFDTVNYKTFLDPQIQSFKLIKDENVLKADVYNKELILEYREFKLNKRLRKIFGKKVETWPKGKQKIGPFGPFCVSREGNVVKIGYLTNNGKEWGERCVTYIGNKDLTEWWFNKMEVYDHPENLYTPWYEQAWEFAQSLLKQRIWLETRCTELTISKDGVSNKLIRNWANQKWIPADKREGEMVTVDSSDEADYVESDEETSDSGKESNLVETVEDSDGEVTDGEVTDGEVIDGEVTDGEVIDGEVIDGEVTDGEITDGEVTDGEVIDGEVTDGEVIDGEVTDGEVIDGEVTDGEITDGEVTDGEATDVEVTDGGNKSDTMETVEDSDVEITDAEVTDGEVTDGVKNLGIGSD